MSRGLWEQTKTVLPHCPIEAELSGPLVDADSECCDDVHRVLIGVSTPSFGVVLCDKLLHVRDKHIPKAPGILAVGEGRHVAAS